MGSPVSVELAPGLTIEVHEEPAVNVRGAVNYIREALDLNRHTFATGGPRLERANEALRRALACLGGAA